uniref:Golgi transport 1B n=1 Tax=Bos taurus TaxID=9913 RepID=A0A3Q1LJT9_BOVIN
MPHLSFLLFSSSDHNSRGLSREGCNYHFNMVLPLVLFVAGLAFVIGLERTFRFFFQKHKMKATGFFLGGVFVVLIGWPLIGMIFEIYGFFLLFRGFFPVVVGFIRRVPVLGSLLNLPGIRSFVDKVGESNNMV